MKSRFLFSAGPLILLAYGQLEAAQLRYYNHSPAPTQQRSSPAFQTPVPPQYNYSSAYRYAPVSPARTNRDGGYFDPGYRKTENRQHLGVDYYVDQRSQRVFPTNEGYVVSNNTRTVKDPEQQRIIVQHPGYQAVYGHVTSSAAVGSAVVPGRSFANVSGSHLHYGENSRTIPQSGWGRAPASTTRSQATEQGWYDPTPSYIPR